MVQVGFIGLGHMGRTWPATSPRRAMTSLAFDMRAEAIDATPGARKASSVAETAESAELVFTSLPGPARSRERGPVA